MSYVGPTKAISEYIIPSDYRKIFKDRTIIITGAGRSGTTIIGKVTGSFDPVYYIFEPALMKLVPFLYSIDNIKQEVDSSLLQSLLFEDYFLQLIHGRSINFNKQDDSYFAHYMSKKDIEVKWKQLSRRQDVIQYLEKERPMFVIKTPEFQPLCEFSEKIFPGLKIIHIIRNGNDTVSSTVNRGWYTDSYMNGEIIDWVEKRKNSKECNVPWYIDDECKSNFPKWNQITRSACIWRTLTEIGMEYTISNKSNCLEIKYEDFIKSTEFFVDLFEKTYALKSSKITKKHLKSIKNHKVSKYPLIYDQIEKPEYNKFMMLMDKLAYLT